MHERNRRQLCRLIFIALCALPTVVTSTWAAYRASPFFAAAQRAAWESSLLERTGLVATIDHVEQPAGGSIVLAGVELIDPDGGERIVRLRQIEVAATAGGQVFLLSQPQISQGKFLRLWDVLHDRVLRGPHPLTAMQLNTGELTVEIGRRAQTFTNVTCTVKPLETGVQVLLDFQLAGLEMPSPARLEIIRDRQINPPATTWMFHTDSAIPCDLFRDYLPVVTKLGPACRFQGHVATTMLRDEWSAVLEGRFLQVDLNDLTDSLPHKLTGLADLTVQKAVFQHGQLSQASGALQSNGGMVSMSLLQSMVEQLGATTSTNGLRLLGQDVNYQQLAFNFVLAPESFTIEGGCGSQRSGVVMSTASDALLSIHPERQHSLISLVRALSPASDTLIPATEQSKELLGILALPPAQKSTPPIARQPRVKVHMH